MKNLGKFSIIPACVLLAACASSTIYPTGDGTFSSVTTSSEEGYAQKTALKKAEEHCKSLNKHIVVLNHNATYQGMDKKKQAVIGVVSSVLIGANLGKRSDDYKVNLKFRCR